MRSSGPARVRPSASCPLGGRAQLAAEVDQLSSAKRALLSSRTRNVVEQLVELKSLRGKNQNIILHMMKRIDMA